MNTSHVNRVLLSLMLALTVACGSETPTAPSVNVPFTQTDLLVGTGTEAVNGRTLSVKYTGWLYSTSAQDQKGQQFDSGTYEFTLGAGQAIKGWDQGFGGMKVGGMRRLVIPPSLGYGAAGKPPIPGNATLIFDVGLLDVR